MPYPWDWCIDLVKVFGADSVSKLLLVLFFTKLACMDGASGPSYGLERLRC